MASNYPTSLDNFTNPTSNDSLNSPSHSLQHANINDAVEAIEAKLGIGASPAGSATSGYVLTAGTGGTTTWQALTIPDPGLSLINSFTLTASTGQAITGLSAGSRYRILINAYGNTNGEIITARFREGSTDKTSNYYGGSFRSGYQGGTGSFLPSDNSAQMFLAYYSSNTNFDALVSFDFWINPSGDVAGITGTALSELGSNGVFFGFNNRNMSACDGINIYPAGGNFTGKLSIYKYKD